MEIKIDNWIAKHEQHFLIYGSVGCKVTWLHFCTEANNFNPLCYMATSILVNIATCNGLFPDGSKPSPEPMSI